MKINIFRDGSFINSRLTPLDMWADLRVISDGFETRSISRSRRRRHRLSSSMNARYTTAGRTIARAYHLLYHRDYRWSDTAIIQRVAGSTGADLPSARGYLPRVIAGCSATAFPPHGPSATLRQIHSRSILDGWVARNGRQSHILARS